MSSYVIADKMRTPVKTRCKELLGNGWEDAEIDQAIRQGALIYSRHRPRSKAADITGDAGFDYPINGTNFPGYVVGFSSLDEIEFPFVSTQADPSYLERDDWTIYDDGTDVNLRFLTATPAASETIRAHYNIPRLDDVDGSVDIIDGTAAVLIDTDFYAVCDLGAAKLLRHIAAKLISTGDSTLQVDTINYRSKSAECIRLAESLEKQYKDHLGISDDAGDSSVPGASVDVDFDTEFAFGGDHVTHPGRWH
jgi:hypothetical protein